MKYDIYAGGFQVFMSALVLSTSLKNKEMLFELGDEQDPQALLRGCNEGFIDPPTRNVFDENATVFCVKGVFEADDCYIVLYFNEVRKSRVYRVERAQKDEMASIIDDMAVEDIMRCTNNENLDVIEMIGCFVDFGIATLYMTDADIAKQRAVSQVV